MGHEIAHSIERCIEKFKPTEVNKVIKYQSHYSTMRDRVISGVKELSNKEMNNSGLENSSEIIADLLGYYFSLVAFSSYCELYENNEGNKDTFNMAWLDNWLEYINTNVDQINSIVSSHPNNRIRALLPFKIFKSDISCYNNVQLIDYLLISMIVGTF